jgi:hypothetical protein
MAQTELGVAGNATTTASAVRIELIGATSGMRTRLMEVGIFDEAATAQVVGFGRPGAIGVTPTTPITLLGTDTVDTATARTAIAWGTPPTLPTNPLRRFALAAAIGGGMVWSWRPNGLIIPLSGSLIFWNIGTGSASLGFYFICDE